MGEESIPRRSFLKGAGAAGSAVAGAAIAGRLAEPAAAQLPPNQAPANPAPATAAAPADAAPDTWLAFTSADAAFVVAAVDTLIPADELSPSGSECGVATYIDRQLASAWGGGAKMYRSGPFHKGKPEQGYQQPLAPREYFLAGIAAANEWVRKTYGKEFDRLAPAERVAALTAMEEGKAEFRNFSSRGFFARLLTMTKEGFFSDPIYGGNRDKVAWKMIGFPGLPATYARLIDEYRDKPYVADPQSIADFS